MGMAIGWLKLALRSFDMSATLALPARRDGDGGVVATAEPRAQAAPVPSGGHRIVRKSADCHNSDASRCL